MNLSGQSLKEKTCGQHEGSAMNQFKRKQVLQFSSNNLDTALQLLENDVPLNHVLHKQVGKLIKSPAQTVSLITVMTTNAEEREMKFPRRKQKK